MVTTLPDNPRESTKIPVTIFTGFLGSGKSSVIRELLTQPAGAGTAVVVNELGAVSIDHAVLGDSKRDVVTLSNGCLCCALKGDLAGALFRLHRAASQDGKTMRRVFVETTGLADPVPILQTFTTDPSVSVRFRLSGLVCTFDLALGPSLLMRYGELGRQLSMADQIVLTKVDVIDWRTLRGAVRVVRGKNRHAELFLSRNGAIRSRSFREDAIEEFREITEHWQTSSYQTMVHSHGVNTFAVVISRPFTWEELADVLSEMKECVGLALLRLKGLVNVAGVVGPVIVHGIQHIFYPPEILASWPNQDDRTKLVFIVDGAKCDLVLEPFRKRGVDIEMF